MSSSTQVQRLVHNGATAIFWRKERTRSERTWWIAEWFLLERCIGLSENYLWKKARPYYKQSVKPSQRDKDVLPDTGISWRFMRENGCFYYDFERIPDVNPTFYRSKLGTLEEIKRMAKMAVHDDDREIFRERLGLNMEMKWKGYLRSFWEYEEEHQVKLSKACAAIEAIREIILERDIDVSRMDWWRMVSEELAERGGISYVPINYRRLKEKVMATMGRGIAEVIDLPRLGNKNAKNTDFEDKELLAWMIQLRAMDNYTNTWIERKIAAMCEMTGKVCPSASWFDQHFASKKVKFLTGKERFGERSREAQIYKGYTPIANALFPSDCWQVDATRMNLLPFWKKVEVDGKNKKVEQFAILIAIRDVHSGDVVGFHVDTKEDCAGYINALRMAVRNTGHLPYEMVFDRFPGHNTPEWKAIVKNVEKLGAKVTVTHKATGKAKLERFWGTLQTVFMQDSEKYYGEGIMSKRATARMNPENLKRARTTAASEGWNFEHAWQEIAHFVDTYKYRKISEYRRSDKSGKSPNELFEMGEKPHAIPIEDWQKALCFGVERNATIRSGMVETVILNDKKHYQIDDYDVLSNYKEVSIRFDFDDLSEIYVFDRAGKFLCIAPFIEPIQVYGPDAKWGELQKSKTRIKEIEEKRVSELDERSESAHEVELLLNGLGSKANANRAEDDYVLNGLGSSVNNDNDDDFDDDYTPLSFSIGDQL